MLYLAHQCCKKLLKRKDTVNGLVFTPKVGVVIHFSGTFCVPDVGTTLSQFLNPLLVFDHYIVFNTF